MGFDLKSLTLEALQERTEFLLAFGSFLADSFSLAELKTALEAIETKILITPNSDELNSLFDIVLPAAQLAEKEGSLTNVDGKIQKFKQTLTPLGASQPEWKIMVELAKDLGMNHRYYRQFSSPELIFQELKKEISFFRKI